MCSQCSFGVVMVAAAATICSVPCGYVMPVIAMALQYSAVITPPTSSKIASAGKKNIGDLASS